MHESIAGASHGNAHEDTGPHHSKSKIDCEEVLLGVDKAHPREAVCGVKGIWVSHAARRAGIATQLLDSARFALRTTTALPTVWKHTLMMGKQVDSMIACYRQHSVKGYCISKDQIAFSQPSQDGLQLALAYTGQRDFLVY